VALIDFFSLEKARDAYRHLRLAAESGSNFASLSINSASHGPMYTVLSRILLIVALISLFQRTGHIVSHAMVGGLHHQYVRI